MEKLISSWQIKNRLKDIYSDVFVILTQGPTCPAVKFTAVRIAVNYVGVLMCCGTSLHNTAIISFPGANAQMEHPEDQQ